MSRGSSQGATTDIERNRHCRHKRNQSRSGKLERPNLKIRGNQRPQERQCTRCGRSYHPIDRCLAKEVICHKSGRKGHYRKQCYSWELAEVTGQKAYLGALTTKQNLSWMSAVQLNNKKVTLKLNTGAEVTEAPK